MRVRKTFNHFHLIEVVGVGGMGTVYKAMDTKLNRFVALKVLRPEYGCDPSSVTQLEREAKITASINHPHVVKVFSFSSAHGQFYFAMELVERGSLDDLMQVQNQIAEVQALSIGIQISQGLEAAYAKGLIHSDIKPGNILFSDPHTAKIVDFGLATLLEQQAEGTGEIWGTPYYVSPERLNKEPEDFRSDMYSLGGTLFHALAGRPPFEDETASLVALKHIKSKAVSLQAFAPHVSGPTAFVINRMLQRRPEDRYDSYAELIEHLEYARNQLSDDKNRTRSKARLVVEGESSQLVSGAIAVALLLGCVLIAWLVIANWGKLIGEDEDAATTISEAQGGQTAIEDKFTEARKAIKDRNFSSAAAILNELVAQEEIPQPTRNWIQLHGGWVALVTGETEKSRQEFLAISQRGAYSLEQRQLAIASFFVDVSKVMATENAVPARVSSLYADDSFEAMAPLLFGFKNWALEDYEQAASHFERFIKTNPPASYPWIAEYKPMVNRYIKDLEIFIAAKSLAEDAKTREEMQKAIENLKAVRPKLSLEGSHNTELIRIASQLEYRMNNPDFSLPVDAKPTPTPTATPTHSPTPTPPPAIPAGPTNAETQEEENALSKWESEVRMAARDHQFQIEMPGLNGFKTVTPQGKERAEALQKKMADLNRFFELLAQDLRVTGYSKPILRKSGPSIEGKATSANAEGIQVEIPYGSVPVPWRDMEPQTILETALHFATDSATKPPLSERLWLAGVFAFEVGLEQKAAELLNKAASSDAAKFKSRLHQFPGIAAE